MGRVACESRLPIFFFDGTNHLFFVFLYWYIERMINLIFFHLLIFLMVIRLFVKKVVPLYIKEKEIVLTK